MSNTAQNAPVAIANISIKQDAQGRFSLNSLHKASGGEQKHQPRYWLANQQAKELISELEKENSGIPLFKSKGCNGGTYAVKELVYAYAMWISPKFHLQVIRAYDALQRPALPVLHFPISAASPHDREFGADCLSPRKLLDPHNRQLELELLEILEGTGMDISGLKVRILAMREALLRYEDIRNDFAHLKSLLRRASDIAEVAGREYGKNVTFTPVKSSNALEKWVYRDQPDMFF